MSNITQNIIVVLIVAASIAYICRPVILRFFARRRVAAGAPMQVIDLNCGSGCSRCSGCR